jgi:hypothetical protein
MHSKHDWFDNQVCGQQGEAIRDGKAGAGIYKAMQRAWKKSVGRTDAASWLWWTVADLQLEHKVAVLAERKSRGRWDSCARRVNWRKELRVEEHTDWNQLVAGVMRAVLRLESCEEEGLVTLHRSNWGALGQAVNKEMRKWGMRTSVALRVCLWELAAEQGLLVEDQDTDQMVGGDWRAGSWWEDVVKELGRSGMGGLEHLEHLVNRIRGWAAADMQLEPADKEYLVDWCAGWPEVVRRAAARVGVEVPDEVHGSRSPMKSTLAAGPQDLRRWQHSRSCTQK